MLDHMKHCEPGARNLLIKRASTIATVLHHSASRHGHYCLSTSANMSVKKAENARNYFRSK